MKIRFIFAIGCFGISSLSASAGAWDLEFDLGSHSLSGDSFNAFSAMNPTATTWDNQPAPPKLSSFRELTIRAFPEQESWGKWGAFLTATLPQTLTTSGQATNSTAQSKSTSLGGFRLGPEVRWFPLPAEGEALRWFVGGKIGIGLFSGSQTYRSGSESQFSYRAWSAEFAVSTGLEFPVGPLQLVGEVGYSRLNSSYFAATGNSGSAYSDFSSGTRIQTNTGMGYEDLKLKASGLFASLGLQMTFGDPMERKHSSPASPAPLLDDYEGSTPTPAPTPTSIPTSDEETAPTDEKTSAPEPAPNDELKSAPAVPPAADSGEKVSKPVTPSRSDLFLPPMPSTSIVPMVPIEKVRPLAPEIIELAPMNEAPRKAWEIDAVPSESVPDTSLPRSPPAVPSQPDQVPLNP
ncbi:MAG: hypothetical protein H7301_09295 [Cryobacterium sp.]|nr:hypothetical protein [Oligoflexia bacterium]